MKIVEQQAIFRWATPNIGEQIEKSLRKCYQSEDKIKEGSAERIYNQVVKQSGHQSVAEHGVISLDLVTDRATMAQLTRHRLFSFSISSQRYINLSKEKFGGEIEVIKPYDISTGSEAWKVWKNTMQIVEGAYFSLIETGCKPEVARSVLPNSAVARISITGNVRVWRNFFQLRSDTHAQKDIQYLSHLIYQSMMENGIPEYLFSDIMK
jgi:thymidylate synthase (FAD)